MTQFRPIARRLSLLLAFSLLFEAFFPTAAWALTSGPTQPEAAGFTPAGTSDMVDLFTGDFAYNIPLLDVGGYPLNLAYKGGPSMDEEASWVGLGWSLTPGVINRDMRGVPDEFAGDSIVKEFNMKKDITTGMTVGGSVELAGGRTISIPNLGIYKNTYRGYGITVGLNVPLLASKPNKSGFAANLGLKLNFDTQNGLDISPSLGFSSKRDSSGYSLSMSTNINSRRGLRDLSLNGGVQGYSKKLPPNLPLMSGGMSFGASTYVPASPLPLKNLSFSFAGTIGGDVYTVHPNVNINGYRTEQGLAYKKNKQPAYGYLNSQSARPSDIMDFNRDRNGLPFRKNMVTLPIAYGTPDLFSVTGQGMSGQFRLYRNEVGHFSEPSHHNNSTSGNLGVEVGFGSIVHFGADINILAVNSTGSIWQEDNEFLKVTPYTSNDGKTTYEPAFFKESGDLVATNTAFFASIGGTAPVRVGLSKNGSTVTTKKALIKTSNKKPDAIETKIATGSILKRASRVRRNDVMSYLTANEATKLALDKRAPTRGKPLVSYKKNTIRLLDAEDCGEDATYPRHQLGVRPGHHISEVTVTRPDGSRYVYGIPAYNFEHREVSFSVAKPTDPDKGVLQYAVGDNSTSNTKGLDNYFDAQNLPPFAHSYLLTAVVSPDFIDRTDNGVTDDDYGTAVRLNYHRLSDPFKWRAPMADGEGNTTRIAKHTPGLKSDDKDDKGSYLYGKKEVWYTHSIESKTMLAQFYLSDRFDGLGADDEDGGLDTDTRLQKLDSIALFSKADLIKNGTGAIPIKVVHFAYGYELCPGVPNFDSSGYSTPSGKLTLKKLWFTYGKSQRGRLNAYHFTYSETNPAYDINDVDRWGSYKENPAGHPSNLDYPYTLQGNTALSNQWASAWSLTAIELPSGGLISVDYESDDYAYVQDKRAGQMVFVRGFGEGLGTYGQQLYDVIGLDVKDYVYVDVSGLGAAPTDYGTRKKFRARFLEGIDKIYFNILVDLDKNDATPSEYVNGYFDYLEQVPLDTTNISDGIVGIPIDVVETSRGNPIHPVTKAGLQLLRQQLPQYIFPGYTANDGFEAAIKGLIGLFKSIGDLLVGFEENSMAGGRARYVTVSNDEAKNSWVRLANPSLKKLGGGHRVKRITISDDWDVMSGGEPAAVYGQEYGYTTTARVGDQEGVEISSGVAAYEPIFGNDENLCRSPLPYHENNLLAPGNSYYTEEPFGEALFPAPTVGYSEVRVTNLPVGEGGTGWTVHKFFTARDFPVIADYTAPKSEEVPPGKLNKFFKMNVRDYLTMSQGFLVEINDMHGKMKEESSYDNFGSSIASTLYHYKVDSENTPRKHLKNTVKVISPDGDIETSEWTMGVDVDFWQDLREDHTTTQSLGAAFNTEGFVWPFPPIPVVVPFVKAMLQTDESRFRSVVTTKFVKRQGILDRITKVQDGSTITTENLYYDSETGQVLMTKTQNEHNDPIYQFTYPAHWAYDGMGQAYKNIGTFLSKVKVFNGVPHVGTSPLPGYASTLAEGDEMGYREYLSLTALSWEYEKLNAYKVGTDSLRLYKANGQVFNPGSKVMDIKVVRPGRRNMAGAPVGSVVMMTAPSPGDNIHDFLDTATGVVDATANTFEDLWQREILCDGGHSWIFNPYTNGMKGAWRPSCSYVNYRQRTGSALAGNTNIRTEGVNDGFVPFWDYSGGKMLPEPPSSNWVMKSQATKYDFKGNQVEEVDALGIYSSAIFGYKHSVATAVAHNARYQQVLNEGFEDDSLEIAPSCDKTGVSGCFGESHGVFGKIYINQKGAHTGRYSLRVGATKKVTRAYNTTQNPDYPLLSTTTDGGVPVYINGAGAHIPAFSPAEGYYTVSAWVKIDSTCGVDFGTYAAAAKPAVVMSAGTDSTAESFYTEGPVVEGWQRIFGKYRVMSWDPTIQISLKGIGTSGGPNVYFDDIRIHPYLGNMKSFVYDPRSMRLMATLDENNYATFYEYDEEGRLVRTKRETERGIMTIQENRSVLRPNN